MFRKYQILRSIFLVIYCSHQSGCVEISDKNDTHLLGAGSGLGSCTAPPFRSSEVHWRFGCPPFASCCTEFGYCRSQVINNHQIVKFKLIMKVSLCSSLLMIKKIFSELCTSTFMNTIWHEYRKYFLNILQKCYKS